MGRSFWLACLLAWATEQQAQPSLFSPLQQVVRGPVYCFLEDSVTSSFYIGGGLIGAYDMPLSPGIVRWDAAEFHNVGCGFEYDCLDTNTSQVLATPVRALEHWQGALSEAGDFQQSVGVSVNFIARWDGVDSLWKPLQNGISNRFEVSVQELAEANDIANPNNIAAGQVLVIPDQEFLLQSPLPTRRSQPTHPKSNLRKPAVKMKKRPFPPKTWNPRVAWS